MGVQLIKFIIKCLTYTISKRLRIWTSTVLWVLLHAGHWRSRTFNYPIVALTCVWWIQLESQWSPSTTQSTSLLKVRRSNLFLSVISLLFVKDLFLEHEKRHHNWFKRNKKVMNKIVSSKCKLHASWKLCELVLYIHFLLISIVNLHGFIPINCFYFCLYLLIHFYSNNNRSIPSYSQIFEIINLRGD